jgi:TPR repeat protein
MPEWLRQLWGPTREERRRWCRKWDFDQVDRQAAWEREADPEPLRQAQSLSQEDPERAFQVYLAQARLGSVWAMGKVGWLYQKGVGVPPDVKEAEAWYRRAAEHGDQHGILAYSTFLLARGDLDHGAAILEPAANENWAPALYWLAWVRLKKSRSKASLMEARALLERAAADGCPAAQQSLGMLLGSGRFGLGEIPRGFRLLQDFHSRSREALAVP